MKYNKISYACLLDVLFYITAEASSMIVLFHWEKMPESMFLVSPGFSSLVFIFFFECNKSCVYKFFYIFYVLLVNHQGEVV